MHFLLMESFNLITKSFVWKIHLRILEEMEDDDIVISDMTKSMKEKFDKYWDCHNIVLSFTIMHEFNCLV